MKPQQTSKHPTHDVLVASNLNKKDANEKDYLRRIGAAWAHGDGKGFTLQMFALPLDGRLVLREPLPDEEQSQDPQDSYERRQSREYADSTRGR